MSSDGPRSCHCGLCTGDCEEPPQLVSRATWCRHQENVRRRLSHGGPAAGLSRNSSVLEEEDPQAGKGGGTDCCGGKKVKVDDCPPGPDRTAEGEFAA